MDRMAPRGWCRTWMWRSLLLAPYSSSSWSSRPRADPASRRREPLLAFVALRPPFDGRAPPDWPACELAVGLGKVAALRPRLDRAERHLGDGRDLGDADDVKLRHHSPHGRRSRPTCAALRLPNDSTKPSAM